MQVPSRPRRTASRRTATNQVTKGRAGDFGTLTAVCGPNEGGGALADAGEDELLGLDLVAAVGGKVAVLGAQSMSAWLLFATSAKECDLDDNLTRSCVLETAAATSEWDGGGLHAVASPATNEGPDCVIVLQVADGAFTRFLPEEDYHCDPDDIVTVPVVG